MKKQLAATFILISTPFLFVSCVSSLLQEKAPTFSSEVAYTAPQTNFKKINRSVFPAWKNSKTNNVISIVSDCNENSAITLAGLNQLILDSVEQAKLIKQQQIVFKNKPALLSFGEGALDGAAIEIRSMSFKRKNCGYVTSLSGKPNTLDQDQKYYDAFNESLTFE